MRQGFSRSFVLSLIFPDLLLVIRPLFIYSGICFIRPCLFLTLSLSTLLLVYLLFSLFREGGVRQSLVHPIERQTRSKNFDDQELGVFLSSNNQCANTDSLCAGRFAQENVQAVEEEDEIESWVILT